MNISQALAQSGGADWVRKVSGKDSVEKTERQSPAKKSDSVSISGSARQLSSTAEVQVRSRVDALPEVRDHRVQEVRERVEQGVYNTPEFAEKLAEKLAQNWA